MTAACRRHFYLLTECDIPFVQDGLRDGETIRQWMTVRFEQALAGRAWVKISGSREQRFAAAIQAIDPMLE